MQMTPRNFLFMTNCSEQCSLSTTLAKTFGKFSYIYVYPVTKAEIIRMAMKEASLLSLIFFNIVYIVERDPCPYGSLIRVGKVKVWSKVGWTNVLIFFSPLHGGKGREALLVSSYVITWG